MGKPTLWAVLGPTASGKSDVALSLAQRYNGEIISCDSVQVYRFFDIGSAKASLQQRVSVPHHLIDVLDPLENCTTGFWRDQALEVMQSVLARGKLPIITGGTGLYFKALYQGLFQGVSTSPDIRARLEIETTHLGLGAMYERLQKDDPDYAAKIQPQDKLRIIRALEAFEVTGRPFSQLHRENKRLDCKWILIMPDVSRDELYQRIMERTKRMLNQGLVDETHMLIQKFPQASALGSIGYKEACAYLRGELDSLEELESEIVKNTRRFAKRQLTLYRSLFKEEIVHTPEEFL